MDFYHVTRFTILVDQNGAPCNQIGRQSFFLTRFNLLIEQLIKPELFLKFSPDIKPLIQRCYHSMPRPFFGAAGDENMKPLVITTVK